MTLEAAVTFTTDLPDRTPFNTSRDSRWTYVSKEKFLSPYGRGRFWVASGGTINQAFFAVAQQAHYLQLISTAVELFDGYTATLINDPMKGGTLWFGRDSMPTDAAILPPKMAEIINKLPKLHEELKEMNKLDREEIKQLKRQGENTQEILKKIQAAQADKPKDTEAGTNVAAIALIAFCAGLAFANYNAISEKLTVWVKAKG